MTAHASPRGRVVAGGLLVAALVLVGCAPVGGPLDVEAVRPGPTPGTWELGTVTLHDVVDVTQGAHERFDVRGGLALSLDVVLLGDLAAAGLTWEAMVEAARPGEGVPPAPQIAFNPLTARWEAEDFDSLYYLSMLGVFERCWSYYQDVVGDTSTATTDHGLVGLYGSLILSQVVPFPLQPESDNAAFITVADAWLTFRVFDQDGIPLAMNDGVIAHEFQHRLFFHKMIRPAAFDWWRTAILSSDAETTTSVSMLRGMDEGLADIFAVGMVGDPSFVDASFQDALLSVPRFSAQTLFRDLEGDFAASVTFDAILNDELEGDARAYCGSPNAEDPTGLGGGGVNPYCLGTVIARTLWVTAGSDAEVLRARILPAVARAEEATSEAIALRSSMAGAFRFGPELLLEEIARELGPGDDRVRFCAEAAAHFTSLVDLGLVPTCP